MIERSNSLGRPALPTTIWLLRHAETASPHILHGAESDIGLSERGHEQARRMAQLAAEFRPQALVSSGMLRARLTAEPIAAACGLTVRIEPQLHERAVGMMSGQPTGENAVWTRTLAQWQAGNTGYAEGGAESFDAIRDRVLPVWQRLADEYVGQRVVVIAHGMVIRVLLLCLLYGQDFSRWQELGPIKNLAITELVCSGESWQALQVNQLPAPLALL